MSKFCKTLLLLIMVICLSTATILAADQAEISIGNVTDGARIAGLYQIIGTVTDNTSINKIAVKVGQGPWESAIGKEKWEYTVNTRRIALSHTEQLDPVSGEMITTYEYRRFYGDLEIVVAAFDRTGSNLGQKAVTLTVVPEAPTADINPDEQGKLSVVLKAAPDVSIFYSIDGTDPTRNGFLYNGTITVDPSAIVKVAAGSNNNLYSEIRTLDLNSFRVLSDKPTALGVFNGNKIYTIVTVQPANKPEANENGYWGQEYSGDLISTGITSPNNLAFEIPKDNELNMSVDSSAEADWDSFLRQKENELLGRKISQLNKGDSRGYYQAPPPEPVVNETQWNNVIILLADRYINTTCRYISDHAYFYVDNRDDISQYLADYGKAFDRIYEINLEKFGAVNDIDNNGKVIIVFSREISGHYLGYFYSGDKYGKTTEPYSNEGDIFYINATKAASNVDIIKSTLAHELQHMIYFDQHANHQVTETYAWLNEALSQAAEYYSGFLTNQHDWIENFLNNGWHYLTLTHWNSNNYGYGAIFIRYLIDQYGDEAIKNMCAIDKVGVAAVEAATGEDFNIIFSNFTHALVLSGTSNSLDPRYRFTSLDLQTIQPLFRGGLYTGYSDTGNSINCNLYPYQLSFSAWNGTSGTMTLTGQDSVGTVFGFEERQLIITGESECGSIFPGASITLYKGLSREITATPNEGYLFVNWTKVSGAGNVVFGNADSAKTSVTLTGGDATIRANYLALPGFNKLTLTYTGLGETNPPGLVKVRNNGSWEITATPNIGYTFVNWTKVNGAGDVVFSDANSESTTVTLSGGDATIQANFMRIYTLTVNVTGNGTTDPSGAVIVKKGESLNITATPSEHYRFVNWTKSSGYGTVVFGNADSATTTVTVTDDDAVIRANFEAVEYELTVYNNWDGYKELLFKVKVVEGVPWAIYLDEKEDYQFVDCTKIDGPGNVVFYDTNSENFTAIITGGDATIQVNYIRLIDLNVTCDGKGETSPSGLVKVLNNANNKITATPNKGYHFVTWTQTAGAGEVVFSNANSPITYLTVSGGTATIRANFAPGIMGDVDGDGWVTSNDAFIVALFAANNEVTSFNKDLADVNYDGKIESDDALLIAKFVAGLITKFE